MWILRSTQDIAQQSYTFRMTAQRPRTIGRGPRADFVLDVPLVSRLHCRLVVINGELIVENLASTNGTFVNDESIERSTLKPGDRLRTGRVELIVSTE